MADSPFDRALALCRDDKARLELARLGAELGLGASSEEWIIVVLYAETRRVFGPAAVNGSTIPDDLLARFDAVATRLETVPVRSDVRSAASIPPSRHFPFIGVLALAVLLSIAAWFVGATVATAHVRFTQQRVATLLTTAAGKAALRVLDANGTELPQNLARCRRFSIAGRGAGDCVLWSEGPARAPQREPFWAFRLALRSVPAWPFILLAIAALTIAAAIAMTNTGPRVRRI